MSYCGAMPVEGIDACLARLRREAGLESEPMMPALRRLLASSRDDDDLSETTDREAFFESSDRIQVRDEDIEISVDVDVDGDVEEDDDERPTEQIGPKLDLEQIIPSTKCLPSAESIVRLAVKTPPPGPAQSGVVAVARTSSVPPPAQSGRVIFQPKRSFIQRLAWPVFLCGFLGGVFGGMAVMKSPVGNLPIVHRVVKSVKSQAAGAYAVTTGATGTGETGTKSKITPR